MAHIRVDKSFDYRWPSGSITAFRAGPEILTTRRECVEYAVAKGYGVDTDVKGKGDKLTPLPELAKLIDSKFDRIEFTVSGKDTPK